MYPNSQLGLAGTPAVHTQESNDVFRTPAYKHLAVLFAVFVTALIASSASVLHFIADKQVVYQPAAHVLAAASETPIQSQSTPPAPAPAVAAPVQTQKDASDKVQAVLNSWASTHNSQQWSVAVQGLGSDKTAAAINQTASFNTASVYKLFFTYSIFKNYSLESLPQVNLSVDGRGTQTLKDCLELAIKNSDNPCGEAIGYKLGWGKTNTALKGLGLNSTNLNDPNGITTTAADANTYLQKLASGQLMNAADQQYLIGLMQQQKYRGGIPAGCPNCTVADKIGDLGFVRHDIAIVQYPGGSYTVAIMTNGAPYAQIAQLESLVQSAISS